MRRHARVTVYYQNYETGMHFSPTADHFCWISNGMALLLVVGVPVALILLFNFAALSFTMVSIFKVQKVSFEIWI